MPSNNAGQQRKKTIMIHLLTHEKDQLAFFIMQSKENQSLILSKAKIDHTISRPLLDAYSLIMESIR